MKVDKMYIPKISIIIPAYNASNYLAEAIESALHQTYSNIEVIVVNDGSNDDGATRGIALSYGEAIRYFEKENGGSSSALNVGIKYMTGEWFCWLSHDDLYKAEKIEKQLEYMSRLNIDVTDLPKHVFFSAAELIDATGRMIRRSKMEANRDVEKKVESFPHNGFLIAEPTIFNFHGCSCLIHKDVFHQIGYFDESLRLINDLDFWYRIYSANYIVHYIPEPLVKGRIHVEQVSNSIAFSYHNPEQDMFWKRSLEWLIANYPNEKELFYRYARNAYLKTRDENGDSAMEHLLAMNAVGVLRVSFIKFFYKSVACVRNIAKKIYLKIRL